MEMYNYINSQSDTIQNLKYNNLKFPDFLHQLFSLLILFSLINSI